MPFDINWQRSMVDFAGGKVPFKLMMAQEIEFNDDGNSD